MAQIHINLRADSLAFIAEQQEHSGQSFTKCLEALIGHARRQGWEVQPTLAVVERGTVDAP